MQKLPTDIQPKKTCTAPQPEMAAESTLNMHITTLGLITRFSVLCPQWIRVVADRERRDQ